MICELNPIMITYTIVRDDTDCVEGMAWKEGWLDESNKSKPMKGAR